MDRKKHFLSLADYSREEILALLARSGEFKSSAAVRVRPGPLEGKSIGLIFEKPSTRTRISFEVGIDQLGGHAIFLNRRDIQMGRGEPVRDTARVLSRYLAAVVIRTFGQEVVEEFAAWSSIPVINPAPMSGAWRSIHPSGGRSRCDGHEGRVDR